MVSAGTSRSAALAVSSAAAAAGLVRLRGLVRERRLQGWDRAVRAWMRTHRSPVADRVLRAGDVVGKPPVSVALAAIGGALLARRRRFAVGVTVPAAALLAFAVQKLGKRAFLRGRPPRARSEGKTEPGYPSGHVTTTVAVGLVSAYVLHAERLVPAAASLPVAAALVGLAGGAKLYDERHWASDLLGGVLAGVAVAALVLGTWEALDGDRVRRRGGRGR